MSKMYIRQCSRSELFLNLFCKTIFPKLSHVWCYRPVFYLFQSCPFFIATALSEFNPKDYLKWITFVIYVEQWTGSNCRTEFNLLVSRMLADEDPDSLLCHGLKHNRGGIGARNADEQGDLVGQGDLLPWACAARDCSVKAKLRRCYCCCISFLQQEGRKKLCWPQSRSQMCCS